MSWTNFASSIKTTESTFSQAIGGTTLGQGTHQEVVIVGIEPGTNPNYPSMKIIWEKDNQTKSENIFFLDYQKTGLSNQYLMLATALVNDIKIRQDFFGKAAPENGFLYNSLVGMKANLVIGHKKVNELDKKFKIKNLNDGLYAGRYVVVDAFDDKTTPKELEPSYEDFQSAKEAAEEYGLSLSYLNVLKISPVKNKEIVEQQTKNIKLLLKTKKQDLEETNFY